MRVSLFATCLVDQLWPSVGLATLDVLERVGCEVHFDERQTCCGQPAYNSGYREEARRVGRHFLAVFGDAEAIVAPSGSCVAMVRHLPELFAPDEPERERAERVAGRTHDLAGFLVNVLGRTEVASDWTGRLTWHDACHGLRELGLHSEPRRLLGAVPGLELVELEAADTCCGFGGTFSVKYPELSVAILDRKLAKVEALGVEALCSGDASCLLHLRGRLQRRKSPLRVLHLAEVLAGGPSR